MAFRPEDYRPDENEPEQSGQGWVPAGDYALAFIGVTLKKGESSNGKWAFGKFKARVLWAKGDLEKHVGETVYLDCGLLTAPQRQMLGRICFGMGLTNEDEFDPMNARELKRALLYRPLFTSLKKTVRGEYTNNQWGKIFPFTNWSEAMRERVASWREDLIGEFGDPASEEEQQGEGYGGDGDPGPTDDDAPQGRYF